jgi:hypothetical protein
VEVLDPASTRLISSLYTLGATPRETTFSWKFFYCYRSVLISPLSRNGNSSIVVCVFISAGICLPSRCLAMNVYTSSALPAFRCHVTIFFLYLTHAISSSFCRASNGRMIADWWIGKDMEGNGGVLMCGTVPTIIWREGTKDFSQDSRCRSRDTNRAPPEYEPRAVPPCYEGESINRSQIDIKRKTYDGRTWKKLFLVISSTNIDTLNSSLCQCVETRSIEASATFAPPF